MKFVEFFKNIQYGEMVGAEAAQKWTGSATLSLRQKRKKNLCLLKE
jgi:hypothetical protein